MSSSREMSVEQGEGKAKATHPWGRLLCLCFACSVCSGILPGQALFAELFSTAGTLSSACQAGGDDAKMNDDGTCKAQLVAITAWFQTGSTMATAFLAPIGLVYDRWGAKKTGVSGAAMCAGGLLFICLSLMGVSSMTTDTLFVVGIFVCDFGAMLNSFAIMGLVWHFPGSQALVIALINATYQVSAFLPLGIQALVDRTSVTIPMSMCGYTFLVVTQGVVCHCLTPTQEEYYSQAKSVLGMPLPKPPKKLNVGGMICRAWEVLRLYTWDHVACCLGLVVGFTLPTLYAALASGYGEALFGTEEDGKKLAEIFVSLNGLSGLCFSPVSGFLADVFGLKAFIIAFGVIEAVASFTVGMANWTAQTLCAGCLVIFTSLLNLFITRYILQYSPPNRLGTVQGVFAFMAMVLAAPLQGVSLGVISSLPQGPDAYRWPMRVVGAAGAICMAMYLVYFNRNPPPEVPPLLGDDERELANGFGCVTLDEVAEVTHVATRKELLKKLASTNPETTLELARAIDADKMVEVMARRPVEDIAKMLEDAEDEEDEEEAEEMSTARDSIAPLLSDTTPRDPLLSDNNNSDNPLPSEGAAREPMSSEGPMAPRPSMASDIVGVYHSEDERQKRHASHEDLGPLLEEVEQQEEANEDLGDDREARIQAMSDRFVEAVRGRRKQEVIDSMLKESVEDINAMMIYQERAYSAKEQKQLDKDFNATVPKGDFAKLLRQRPELRQLVQQAMKREVQRKVAAMRGKSAPKPAEP